MKGLVRISHSLEWRLMLVSVTTALVALAGAGGIVVWRMHHLLLVVAERGHLAEVTQFHEAVESYQQQLPPLEALQLAVNQYSLPNRWIRVTLPGEAIRIESDTYHPPEFSRPPSLMPQVEHHRGHTLIRCGQPIALADQTVARVETITDVTRSARVYQVFLGTLVISGGGSVLLVAVIGLFGVRRSLRPLRKISTLSSQVSADTLQEARLVLGDPPTEMADLAEAFNDMLNRLSRAWEHERHLLSTISHELRTPLSIVQGYLESTLRRGENLNEIQLENLAIAQEECRRIIRMLKDLLDLARVESGSIHLQLQPLCLNEFMKELGSLAQHLGENPVSVELPAPILSVKADRDRLKQVVLNLITNAIRYSDNHAPITLYLRRQEDRALLQVEDRGIGIPEEKLPFIFQRFYSVSEARSRSQGGVGLGLAISKALVEQMRGQITVKSTVGAGSTFTILLPISELE